MLYIYFIFFKEDCQGLVSVKTQKTYKPLLFTSFTATYAQKPQNSDFAHVCLGFITQEQRENTSRRQRVNSNLNGYS